MPQLDSFFGSLYAKLDTKPSIFLTCQYLEVRKTPRTNFATYILLQFGKNQAPL
jgi:hypothetical protein